MQVALALAPRCAPHSSRAQRTAIVPFRHSVTARASAKVHVLRSLVITVCSMRAACGNSYINSAGDGCTLSCQPFYEYHDVTSNQCKGKPRDTQCMIKCICLSTQCALAATRASVCSTKRVQARTTANSQLSAQPLTRHANVRLAYACVCADVDVCSLCGSLTSCVSLTQCTGCTSGYLLETNQ